MSKKLRKIIMFVLTATLALCVASGCNCGGCSKNPEPASGGDFKLLSVNYTIPVGGTVTPELIKDDGVAVSWKSYDDTVATVTAEGVITGVKEGVTYVCVSSDDKTTDCKVTVIADDEVLTLGITETVLVKGGDYTFTAVRTSGGKPCEDVFEWTVSQSEKCTLTANGSTAKFVASETGDYIVTVKGATKSATCKIKVVSENAVRAGSPEITVSDCKTVNWTSVDGATSYAVSINGGEYVVTESNTFDISAYTDVLHDGESMVIRAKTLTDGKYDYIDSYVSEITFSHSYVRTFTEGKEATCTKEGEANFACSVCGKNYKEENYKVPHEYKDYRCEICGELYSKAVTVKWDDNYISLPEDNAGKNGAKFPLVYDENDPEKLDATFAAENADAWKVKYYNAWTTGFKSVGFDIKGEYSNNWMMLFRHTNNNRYGKDENGNDLIPESVRQGTYCITGSTDTSLSEIYLPGTYDDGEHGVHEVTYLKQYAFKNFGLLKKIVFSENIKELRGEVFDGCLSLETVVMQGVSYLPSIYNTPEYNQDNFKNCYALKEIVVGKGFVNNARTFFASSKSLMPTGFKAQLDVFVYDETGAEVSIDGSHDIYNEVFLTGSYYYYDSTGTKCDTWSFADESKNIVYRRHNFKRGICDDCGAYDGLGINYEYVEGEGYYIAENTTYDVNVYGKIIKPLSEYNDGTNGTHKVVGVKYGAFNGTYRKSYNGITHIILPNSVEKIEGSAFWRTTAGYISMTGVKTLKKDSGNAFLYCLSLSTVIVGSEFNSKEVEQLFPANGIAGTPLIDLYVYGDSYDASTILYPNSTKNGQLSGKIFTYDERGICGTWKYAENGYDVVSIEHKLENGVCKNCGKIEDYGINYVYVDGEGYYITANNKYDVETYGAIIKPLSEYNDGIHGKHAVVGVKTNAFNTYNGSYKGITHIILPTSVTKIEGYAFSRANATYISMLGVTELIYDSKTDNQFHACGNLTTLVINSELSIKGTGYLQVFPKGYDTEAGKIVVYVKGDSYDLNKLYYTMSNNNELSGKVYTYNESGKCETWKYAENGYDVVLTVHEYENDVCKLCGKYEDFGVNYVYVAGEGYYVTANNKYDVETYGAIVKPLSEYNDGENGKYAVVGVKTGAFNGTKANSYNGITHIILPNSVEKIEGSAFWRTTAEYISVTGVKTLKKDSGNAFLYCLSLSTVIVGSEFNSKEVEQLFPANGVDGTPLIDLYVYGDSYDASTILYPNSTKNGQLSGKVYTYNGSGKCETWKYAENGYDVVLTVHEYESGECKHCGKYEDYGVNYVYVDGEGYYVTANDKYDVKTYGAIVKPLSEYNDGTNGKYAVVGVKKSAFNTNANSYKGVTHIIMPTSVTKLEQEAFYYTNAEYISILGVTKVTTGNVFLRCGYLKTLVLGAGFDSSASQQVFPADNRVSTGATINIYIESDSYDWNTLIWNGKLSGTDFKNGQLTGKIYTYNESGKCETWKYAENGYDVVLTVHEYESGECKHCGKYEDYGVKYAYVAGEGYYVTANDKYDVETYGAIVKPLSEYNDGENGTHAVVGVKQYAFYSNTYKGVTHIILPASVTKLEGSAFTRTGAEYISMLGVETVTEENTFLYCINLKTLVVCAKFSSIKQQTFPKTTEGVGGTIDIYIESDTYDWSTLVWNGKLSGTDFKNGQLSGNAYTYSETTPADDKLSTTWHYVTDANGNQIATLWSATV